MKRLFLICCFFLLQSCANVMPLEPRNKESFGLQPIPFKNKKEAPKGRHHRERAESKKSS